MTEDDKKYLAFLVAYLTDWMMVGFGCVCDHNMPNAPWYRLRKEADKIYRLATEKSQANEDEAALTNTDSANKETEESALTVEPWMNDLKISEDL